MSPSLNPYCFDAAHGLADSGQNFGHSLDVLIGEDEDGRLISLDGSEFHQGLVVWSGIESERDLLGLVLVDKKDTS